MKLFERSARSWKSGQKLLKSRGDKVRTKEHSNFEFQLLFGTKIREEEWSL